MPPATARKDSRFSPAPGPLGRASGQSLQAGPCSTSSDSWHSANVVFRRLRQEALHLVAAQASGPHKPILLIARVATIAWSFLSPSLLPFLPSLCPSVPPVFLCLPVLPPVGAGGRTQRLIIRNYHPAPVLAPATVLSLPLLWYWEMNPGPIYLF